MRYGQWTVIVIIVVWQPRIRPAEWCAVTITIEATARAEAVGIVGHGEGVGGVGILDRAKLISQPPYQAREKRSRSTREEKDDATP
jgi:hypothetical protein